MPRTVVMPRGAFVSVRLDPHAVGDRIRRLRDKRGLSQRQLAGEACHAAYISVLEKGKRTPSLDTLEFLAAQLRTSSHYLATGQLAPWQHGLDDAGLEAGDLEPHEAAVLDQTIYDAERHAARIFAEAVIERRLEHGRNRYLAGATIEEAAAIARCPLQRLHDEINGNVPDHLEHHRNTRRDATAGEIFDEPDSVLEAIANGDLDVTATTRQLAQSELLDRKRKAER